jgi:FxsC-like protein
VAHQFFFSYSRRNRNDDLDRFVKDLCEKVRLRKHVSEADVVFFDGDAIEVGAPWKQTLSTALRASPVFLALCSPDYINSDYCGKEFQVFVDRYDAHVAAGNPQPPPNAILPILWGAPSASLRDVITRFQYTDDDFPPVYAREGLRYMMELKEHDDDYKKFVTRLAQKIVDAAAHPIPALAQLPPLDDVKSAFHDGGHADTDEGDRAWFVFVAPRPAELAKSRASIDRYKKAGGRDWRPFHPDVKESVGLIAQTVAAQYDRYYAEVPVSANLLDELAKAETTREPVVVLVDPWSLTVGDYKTRMTALDKRIVDTSAILVSWNSPDPDTDSRKTELKALVAKTFAYRARVGRTLHYWGEVDNPSDLKTRLLEMLAHYTNKVLETTNAQKTIPEEQVLGGSTDAPVPLGRPPVVENGPVRLDG